MIKLSRLLNGVTKVSNPNILETKINNITTDSRKVVEGNLFIAYKGVNADGHNYIKQAVNKGAAAVIGEKNMKLQIPYIKVKDGRMAWAKIMSNFYHNPEKGIRLIGISGTDGKTTTVSLIYHILKTSGYRVGMCSTIKAIYKDKTILNSKQHTGSPNPDVLFKFLKQIGGAGAGTVVLEATSHGLAQKRFGDIEFEVSTLTNIAHDHLELHKTRKAYAETKIELLKRSRVAVVFDDIDFYRLIKKRVGNKIKTIKHNLAISHVYYTKNKTGWKMNFITNVLSNPTEITTNLLGNYNAKNIVLAAKVAQEFGVDNRFILQAISSFKPPEGRLEFVKNNLGIRIVVDFAHTAQGITNLLALINNDLKSDEEKVVTVFGCNGDRDRTKRKPMGKVAMQGSNTVVITNEDPRNEDPIQIFTDIYEGCREHNGMLNTNVFRIDDRYKAITYALEKLVKPGDWLLCLGKGHEKSIEIKGKLTDWDETKKIEEIMQNLTSRSTL